MVIIFIVILVVVGIFALWFNVWNHRNPVGKGKKKVTYNLKPESQSSVVNNEQYKEQTARVLKMMNKRSAV